MNSRTEHYINKFLFWWTTKNRGCKSVTLALLDKYDHPYKYFPLNYEADIQTYERACKQFKDTLPLDVAYDNAKKYYYSKHYQMDLSHWLEKRDNFIQSYFNIVGWYNPEPTVMISNGFVGSIYELPE